jgi:hypothetical protein
MEPSKTMSKPAIDLFAYVDNHSIIPVLQAYSLPHNLRLTENQRFYILQEIIAGETRLQGLEGHQRELMERINQLHLEDLLVELDKAQEAFNEAVGVVWIGCNLLLAAIILHYAAVWALLRHAAELHGEPDMPGFMGIYKHWWDVDYKYLRAWKLQADENGDAPAKRTSRSKLYSGNIRGVFFRYIEKLRKMRHDLIGQTGYVAHYIAVGDKSSCFPCKGSVGFYLLGQGPFPGQVCRGASFCRCKRVIVLDPARYNIIVNKPDFSKWDWSMGVNE